MTTVRFVPLVKDVRLPVTAGVSYTLRAPALPVRLSRKVVAR